MKKRNYSICIGIPVYNTDLNLLKKCIEGILNQTYRFFSLVIVDDCSTNGAYEFLQEALNGVDNVYLTRNKQNEGATKTRSKILSLANCDYFLWVDSDDWIDSNYLEKCNDILNKQNTVSDCVIICNATLHYGKDRIDRLFKTKQNKTINKKRAINLLICDRKLKSYPWIFIIPKGVLDKIDFKEAISLGKTIVDDLAISVQYAINSQRIVFAGNITGYHHIFGVQNSESNTGNLEKRMIETYNFILKEYMASISKSTIEVVNWNVLLNKVLCELSQSATYIEWYDLINQKYKNELKKTKLCLSFIDKCGIKFYIIFLMLKFKMLRMRFCKMMWKKRCQS